LRRALLSRPVTDVLPHLPPTPAPSTLSLHDALPIWPPPADASGRTPCSACSPRPRPGRSSHSPSSHPQPPPPPSPSTTPTCTPRSEEHTSELQSRFDLVCRLLLEKKKQRPLTTSSRS